MTADSQRKKVVLLEFSDEVDAFLVWCKNHGSAPDDYLLIALQPEVQVYLKKLGLTYENTRPYFSNESHARALRKSEEWYRFLLEKINISDSSEIRETFNNTFLFYLRLIIHHFLFYCELLSTLGKDHDSIYACIQESVPGCAGPHLADEERYLGRIARDFARGHGLSFQTIPWSLELSRQKGGMLESKPARVFLSRYRRLMLRRLEKEKVFLITAKAYNLGKVALKLKGHFPGLKVAWVCLPARSLAKHLVDSLLSSGSRQIVVVPVMAYGEGPGPQPESVDRLAVSYSEVVQKLQTEWHGRFNYEGLNFVDFFMNKINTGLKTRVLDLQKEAAGLQHLLKKVDVKLVMSPFARETALLLAELASASGVPRLLISHGTLAEPKNQLEEIEGFHLAESLILSRAYDYVALQTPNEEKVFRYFHATSRLVRTGPLILSQTSLPEKPMLIKKLIGETSPDTKILLYPENTRLRNGTRFHVFETFDEFLSSCTDLVNAVNLINGVHLVVRLHPGKKITPDEFKELLPFSAKLTVTSFDYPFHQALTIADLLVNFSSTVIEDALQNHIPVLLYDKWERYMHFEAQRLAPDSQSKVNAVYYINNSLYLKQGIEWILENHLKKNTPEAIFSPYVYDESQREDLEDFIRQEVFSR